MTQYAKLFENDMKVIGPLGTLMFYIEAYKIFTTQNAAAISNFAFILAIFVYINWLIYSIYINENKPLIMTSISGIIGSILILIGKHIYG